MFFVTKNMFFFFCESLFEALKSTMQPVIYIAM